ncbi:hypothetical protein O3P69_011907 [Scylla paramamosain]|uniref:Uncharacterized protein n=1 Tax=Scylla paramamosain TaxID=85552 RepID=A0AAW0SB78_SCYPA
MMMIPAFILIGASETNLGLYSGLTLYAIGRGRNWRTASVPEPPVDAFPAPELNSQPAANLDFYQNSSDTAGQDNHHNTDMHAPDMDMKMEGQESHMMVSDSDASVQEGEWQAETHKHPWEKPGGRGGWCVKPCGT